MGKQYKHLGQVDRDRIKALHDDGYGVRKIGRTLGIDHSTISRELNRNGCGSDGRTAVGKRQTYDPSLAEHKAYVRRKYAKYQGKKIEENRALRDYITTGLGCHWNPDEISGSMRETKQPFYASKTAIYEWLYSGYGQPYCQYLASQRYQPKPHKANKTERVMIPDRVSIDERPLGATNRSRYGHWEGDTLVSGKKTASKTALGVAQERKTKLIAARLIPNLKPESFAQATVTMLSGKRALSLTLDNGIENKSHEYIAGATGANVFFCDPYSSWQKGGVERGNRQLRRYVPKGCDLGSFSQAQIDTFITILNNKPRRCLGYKSALQLAKEKGVITDQSGALRG